MSAAIIIAVSVLVAWRVGRIVKKYFEEDE